MKIQKYTITITVKIFQDSPWHIQDVLNDIHDIGNLAGIETTIEKKTVVHESK